MVIIFPSRARLGSNGKSGLIHQDIWRFQLDTMYYKKIRWDASALRSVHPTVLPFGTWRLWFNK